MGPDADHNAKCPAEGPTPVPVTFPAMRRSTTAAVALTTLIGLFGCASPSETAAPGDSPSLPAVAAGLDDATHATCTLAGQATIGDAGRDLDVATAKDIIAAGKGSPSTLITSAVNVLESAALRAEAAAGTPDEGALVAEVSAAILKVQTVCQDASSLRTSLETPGTGGGGEAGADSEATEDSRVDRAS